MCGIAGVLRVHPPGQAPPPPEVAIPEGWLDILDDSIKHRGPDGHGRFRDRAIRPDGSTVDVAFVHRRLSIIDHAGGHQPMVLRGTGLPAGDIARKGDTTDAYRRTLDHVLNPCPRCASLGCGTIAVVFNGCIYNHRDLRKELEAAGHVFSTDHSDTEVLVHGWGEWREELPQRLDGMFAFVTWDGAKAELALARDRAGEKPLYHAANAFASCVPGLLRVSDAQGRRIAGPVERDAMGYWLRFGALLHAPWPWNEHEGVRPVEEVYPAGMWRHYFVGIGEEGNTVSYHSFYHGRRALAFDQASTKAYGFPSRGERGDLTPDAAFACLRSAVTSRLEADVPVACFLSGGLDSSLIAAIAQEHLRSVGGRLRTITARMPDAQYDESAFGSAVAERLGTDHLTLDTSPRPADDLVRLIRQLGLPFGDSSLLPTHWVSAAARQHAAVALAGDGGDELFGGYDRYRASTLARRWGRLLALLPLPDAPPGGPKSRIARLARLASASRWRGYRDLVSIFPSPLLAGLIGQDRRPIQNRWPDDPLRIDFAHTSFGYLPADLLRKTDTASMAVALEVRAPMLARNMVDDCLGATLSSLMPNGQRKGLLRAVARRYFPPEIVDRPKQGFAIPIGDWFRTDYGGMRQLLLDYLNGPEPFGPDHLGINAMINMGFVKQMLREHDDAGVKSVWPWKGRDHSQRLYMLLVLSIWAKWLGRL